jgi:hypothetical protein
MIAFFSLHTLVEVKKMLFLLLQRFDVSFSFRDISEKSTDFNP